MNSHRVRIRFRKEGDLRLISHRDLARALERLFRRAELPLAMSEGFHPHPRMTFASALALGVQGLDEVVEVVLAQPVDAESVRERLIAHSPPGLVITQTQVLDPQHPKPRVDRVSYELRIPPERQTALRGSIEDLLQQQSCLHARPGRSPVDLRAAIDDLHLAEDRLCLSLRVLPQAHAQPREILQVLGLDDLPEQGVWLVRTKVHLAD